MKNIEIIFSTNSGSKELALSELRKLYKNSNFVKWLNDEAGIIKIDDDFPHISENIKKNNLIFIRHIQPINFKIILTKTKSDLYSILGIVKKIKSLMSTNLSFSIQTRIININSFEYTKKEVYEIIKNEILKDNFIENIKNPQQVISILIADNIYLGISKVNENISKWAGGEARFSAENSICRSESKLLEILENFNIDELNIKSAIDLGCSPGGWSKLLLQRGYKVIGIDPAIVDDEVLNNKNFTHFKFTSEKFIEQNKEKFDLIINDMKMDFNSSIKIINLLKPSLNKNGIIIMTVKLFKNDMSKINDIMLKLKTNYDILLARQFYNNRNEFSVVLKAKS